MKDEADYCLNDYGFHGVKLNGAQNEFAIDDPCLAIPIIEHFAKRGAINAFHIGSDAYEATHRYRLACIAQLFPDIRFLMVHLIHVEVAAHKTHIEDQLEAGIVNVMSGNIVTLLGPSH